MSRLHPHPWFVPLARPAPTAAWQRRPHQQSALYVRPAAIIRWLELHLARHAALVPTAALRVLSLRWSVQPAVRVNMELCLLLPPHLFALPALSANTRPQRERAHVPHACLGSWTEPVNSSPLLWARVRHRRAVTAGRHLLQRSIILWAWRGVLAQVRSTCLSRLVTVCGLHRAELFTPWLAMARRRAAVTLGQLQKRRSIRLTVSHSLPTASFLSSNIWAADCAKFQLWAS